MKKIIKSLVMLIVCTGLAFAQSNTSNVTQNGESDIVSVLQTGSGNTGNATQTGGSFNAAKILQVGATNQATVLTTGSSNTVQFQITHDFLIPNSTRSYLGPMQGDGITQYGTSQASVTQNGEWNWASVAQGQLGTPVTAGQVTIIQTAAVLGGQNIAGVDQLLGNGNIAYQRQLGNDDQSYILQKGASNSAHIEQNNYNAQSDVVQDGTGNVLTQTQTGSAFLFDGTSLSASAYMIGNTNYAAQTQNGVNNTSLITIVGNNNGLAGDQISTSQLGDNNTASIEMGLLAAVNNNLASISQTGSLNLATISIEGGDSNIARITQTTNSDVAHITMTGVSNQTTIVQH